jgi:Na+/proline symporter
MAFLPHVAITTVVLLGLAGIALFPDLPAAEADQITFRVLGHLVAERPAAFGLVLVVMLGVLAAIMSTADSCLLSLSSILTKDVFARWRGVESSAAESLTRLGSMSSILVMLALVILALRPLTTLWDLLVIKFEILIQLSPAFVLGTMHEADDPRGYSGRDILRGLAAGLVIALGLHFSGLRSWHGFHAGTLGVVVNYLTAVTSRRLRPADPAAKESVTASC